MTTKKTKKSVKFRVNLKPKVSLKPKIRTTLEYAGGFYHKDGEDIICAEVVSDALGITSYSDLPSKILAECHNKTFRNTKTTTIRRYTNVYTKGSGYWLDDGYGYRPVLDSCRDIIFTTFEPEKDGDTEKIKIWYRFTPLKNNT